MQDLFNQFFNQFNGYGLDYDHAYGNQCYDLIQEWNVDWLKNSFLPGAYAYQLFYKNPNEYTSILNSATASPQVGDIVVFDNAYNNAGGHTGVATGKGVTQGKSTDWFELFEQNDPTGSVCHLKNYSYNHVIGWLRSKKQPVVQTYQQQVHDIVYSGIQDTQKVLAIQKITPK